ncbi:MAG: glycogen/starch synthase, partial [Bacteroidia bacterium]|nr:glycogen/starch synthase [Bacteroidia bacterium]
YFIDNEEYFQRKFVFNDKKGKFFDDNDERAIFFARGVIETVKKLGWSPDIIHCHGWMSSLVPLYVKTAFKDDALFKNSKVIYSAYNDGFEDNFKDDFSKKAMMEGVTAAHVKEMKNADYTGMVKLAVSKSDAVIQGSEELDSNIAKYITKQGNHFLGYQDPDNYLDAYNEFYDQVLQNDPVLAD